MQAARRNLAHFAFAYGWAIALAIAARLWFHSNPPPRYGDLALPAVALLCARYTWKDAALLFAVAYALLLVAVPLSAGSLTGIERMVSQVLFAGTGAVVIGFVHMAKRRGRQF